MTLLRGSGCGPTILKGRRASRFIREDRGFRFSHQRDYRDILKAFDFKTDQACLNMIGLIAFEAGQESQMAYKTDCPNGQPRSKGLQTMKSYEVTVYQVKSFAFVTQVEAAFAKIS